MIYVHHKLVPSFWFSGKSIELKLNIAFQCLCCCVRNDSVPLNNALMGDIFEANS